VEMKAYVFFVSEDEHPKLQSACKDDFPFTYAQFVARVDEGIKYMAQGISVTKVYARIDEFLAWCAESKVEPNNKSRATYANILGYRQSLH